MKRFLLLLSVLLLVWGSVSAALPASDDSALTAGTARSAAVFAYLFDRIPGAEANRDSGMVTVDPRKVSFYDFSTTPGNLTVQLVWNGKVYSGVEFSVKEGKLVLRGYELESLEMSDQNAPDLKYRVGTKDSISRSFIEFFRTDIMKIAADRLEQNLKKSFSPGKNP